MLTVGGLFSGIGGIESGFEKTGFKILWSNENDPYSVRSFKHNYNHQLYDEDIRKINFKKIKSVDVLVGGFPCQAFSVAGYQKGFEDHRGNLFFEIMRLVDEMEEKPKVLFLENVKNFYSHDKGRTFERVHSELRDRGYSIFTKILNTSEVTKIPQNRERTFIICFKGDADWEFSDKCSASKRFSKLFPPKSLNKTNHIEKYLEKGEVDEHTKNSSRQLSS